MTVAGTCDAPEPSFLAAMFDGTDQHEALRQQILILVATFAASLEAAGLRVASEIATATR
ncbi:MAG: hypothetical protein ACLFU0_04740 [Alphaproteobacteria bacterium]